MSKIDLTWDEDEPQRTRSLKRKFNAEQVPGLFYSYFNIVLPDSVMVYLKLYVNKLNLHFLSSELFSR